MPQQPPRKRRLTDKSKLVALRKAAMLGVADIEAGRFREFDSFDELDRYIEMITDSVTGQDSNPFSVIPARREPSTAASAAE